MFVQTCAYCARAVEIINARSLCVECLLSVLGLKLTDWAVGVTVMEESEQLWLILDSRLPWLRWSSRQKRLRPLAGWKDYQVRRWGILGDEYKSGSGFLKLNRHDGDSVESSITSSLVFHVRYEEVLHRNSPVWCEITWHPAYGEQRSIRGLSNKKADLEIAWESFKLIRAARSAAGRPPGRVSRNLHQKQR